MDDIDTSIIESAIGEALMSDDPETIEALDDIYSV